MALKFHFVINICICGYVFREDNKNSTIFNFAIKKTIVFYIKNYKEYVMLNLKKKIYQQSPLLKLNKK